MPVHKIKRFGSAEEVFLGKALMTPNSKVCGDLLRNPQNGKVFAKGSIAGLRKIKRAGGKGKLPTFETSKQCPFEVTGAVTPPKRLRRGAKDGADSPKSTRSSSSSPGTKKIVVKKEAKTPKKVAAKPKAKASPKAETSPKKAAAAAKPKASPKKPAAAKAKASPKAETSPKKAAAKPKGSPKKAAAGSPKKGSPRRHAKTTIKKTEVNGQKLYNGKPFKELTDAMKREVRIRSLKSEW